MTLAYVGLGANIGDPREHIRAAREDLGGLPHTRVTASSSLYRSAPLDYVDQPEFVNAVVQVDTALAPEALLDLLQDIETRHGRQRPFRGAPRTLDLDLLLYGDAGMATPRLTLPHPRMHERAFVLRPLLELDAAVTIPGKGPASAWLPGCSAQPIERLA
jgi:2-amino-4-hydroxy-6-hydroxymethyldihydropteridine diphosphokinase